MTREDLIRNWDVIEAFKNGENVEYKDTTGEWSTSYAPAFLPEMEYRVKPKQEYVPFDFSDAESLIGRIVKFKNGRIIGIVTAVDEFYSFIGNTPIKYDYLFDNYTCMDGTPCGKLKQNK